MKLRQVLRVLLRVRRLFGINEGDTMPLWFMILYYAICPRQLMTCVFLPRIAGVRVSVDRASLTIYGTEYSLMFFEYNRLRSSNVFRQAFSPDVAEGETLAVSHMKSSMPVSRSIGIL